MRGQRVLSEIEVLHGLLGTDALGRVHRQHLLQLWGGGGDDGDSGDDSSDESSDDSGGDSNDVSGGDINKVRGGNEGCRTL